ncbi:MAG: hypothetical protein NVS3B24_11890 [Candidatus Dormibacteria bacterium]
MTRRRLLPFAAGAAAAAVLAIAALATLRAPQAPPAPRAGQGILARKTPPHGADGGRVSMDDGCFSGYRVQAAGRDAAHTQHFSLTLTLKSSPTSARELAAALNHQGCEGDIRKIVTSLTGVKYSTEDRGLSVFYRTSSGARVTAP